jgi:hypothetical protein
MLARVANALPSAFESVSTLLDTVNGGELISMQVLHVAVQCVLAVLAVLAVARPPGALPKPLVVIQAVFGVFDVAMRLGLSLARGEMPDIAQLAIEVSAHIGTLQAASRREARPPDVGVTRPFSPGMSTPPSPESKPSPWLPFVLSVVMGAAPGLFALGRYTRDVEDLRARDAELRGQVADLRAWKEATGATLAEMKADTKATREDVAAIKQALMNAGAATLWPPSASASSRTR